jgi:hypothetical protein
MASESASREFRPIGNRSQQQASDAKEYYKEGDPHEGW